MRSGPGVDVVENGLLLLGQAEVDLAIHEVRAVAHGVNAKGVNGAHLANSQRGQRACFAMACPPSTKAEPPELTPKIHSLLQALRHDHSAHPPENAPSQGLKTMLARHTPHGITLECYQDCKIFDLWANIQKLPGPGDKSTSGP